MSEPFKVGDILYTSWGYEQTNIDFFRVVKVTPQTVVIEGIPSTVDHSVTGSDYMIPRSDAAPIQSALLDKPQQRFKLSLPAGKTPYIRLADYAYAWRWDGTPKRQTAAGYGH